MAAIAYPEFDRRPSARPHLVLVPPHQPHRLRTPSRRVALRRRRLMALAALVILVLALQLAVHTASAWLGDGSLAVPEPASGAAAGSVYVVQPGDTLWTLARRAQPTGDLRPLVGRLADARNGRALQAGQRLVLP